MVAGPDDVAGVDVAGTPIPKPGVGVVVDERLKPDAGVDATAKPSDDVDAGVIAADGAPRPRPNPAFCCAEVAAGWRPIPKPDAVQKIGTLVQIQHFLKTKTKRLFIT